MAAIKRQQATAVNALAPPARRLAWGKRAATSVAVVVVLGAVALSGRGGVDLMLPLGITLMVALAYANGAKDVSKAIATLAGSGVANYRRAIAWGTACTVLGALCSALVANALIGTFTKGFIAKGAQ